MSDLKYDFNITLTENPFIDSMVYGNTHSYGLLIYSLILFVFTVLVYVYIKRTNDIGQSFLQAFFGSTLVMIIFYYLGKFITTLTSTNVVLVHDAVMISTVLINVIGFAILKFGRNKLNG